MKSTKIAALLLLSATLVSCNFEISEEQMEFVTQVEGTLREFCTRLSDTYTRREWKEDPCNAPLTGCEFTEKSTTKTPTAGYFPSTECGCDSNTTFEDGEMMADFEHSVMMLSSHANQSAKYHEALCRQTGIDAHFVASFKNITYGNDTERRVPLAFYAGFPSGISRIYPGYSWRLAPKGDGTVCYADADECRSFDARTQPWYSVASKGPLDAVFVIDKSKFQGPEPLAAAKEIMKTISSLITNGIDYYRIVAFDEENVTTDAPEAETLSVAEEGAILAATDALEVTSAEADEAKAAENYAEAIKAAVALLEGSRKVNLTSGCRQTIVIMSSVSDLAKAREPLSAYEKDAAPKIFVYTLKGSEKVKGEHKKLTCEYNGLWNDMSDVKDTYDYVTAALSFAELFSSAILSSHVIWSVNNDTTGLGEVYTASRACRWISTVPPKLIAVAGIEFKKRGNEDIFTENFFQNVTLDNNVCPPFELTKFEVENLRKERCENGADLAMIAVTVPVSVILVALTIFGLILSRDSNKFIFDWEKINSKSMGKY